MTDGGNDTLFLAHAARGAILAHARRSYPRECHGLLFGPRFNIQMAIGIENRSDRLDIYEADALHLADAEDRGNGAGLSLVGYYHSHPFAPPTPSGADVSSAAGHASSLPYRLIVSLINPEHPRLAAFLAEEEAWRRIPLEPC